MLISGFLSLVYCNVPMVTIFKNCTNLITIFGEWWLFGEPLTILTILSLVIMVAGAVLAGHEDLQFSFIGYFWMVLNCLFTASYVLYMRYASTNIKLPRFGMVYYNNLLSFFLLLPICILNKEYLSFFNKVCSVRFKNIIYMICLFN